jgi:hypothetical protein
MPTLREIHDDLVALESLLMEVGGDVTEEEAEEAVRAWFGEIQADLGTKLDGYATVIQGMKDRASARREESRRLADLARIDENAVAKLRATLLWFMQDRNHKELNTPLHRFRVANNGGLTPLEIDPSTTPARWKDSQYVQATYEWDTKAIREALDNGVDLPFARYGERGQHVRIK